MILGSHNSFTFMKGTTLLQKLLTPTWKCQTLNLQLQYKKGVRCFDFRLFYLFGKWYAAHGITTFNVDFDEILIWLNNIRDEHIYVRVIYEGGTSEQGKEEFKKICSVWESKYVNIIFFEGRDKKTWEVLYKFPFNPEYIQYISSVLEKCIIKKILPWLYAKRNNKKKYLETVNSVNKNTIVSFDFVNQLPC